MPSFRGYKPTAARWITFIESEFYPDTLERARLHYRPVLQRWAELLAAAESSAALLRTVSDEPDPGRTQLLRVFRRYVSPDTSVEMLKRKGLISTTISEFGGRLRPLEVVRRAFASRPDPDEALMALLYEYRERGRKGYDLTESFFVWFSLRFGEAYSIEGPERAGRDVVLSEALPGYPERTPADFLVRRRQDGQPVAVGFARYDSDRGGAQEDDRVGGNRDKIGLVRAYAAAGGTKLKVIFLNDGPGLLLGSMWDDYAALEEHGEGDVLVCTAKMLDARLTRGWLEG